MHDVAIIGGGPAGSRVAFKIAEKGYDVIVLEKKTDLGEAVCCTGIVSRECVNEFDIPGEVIYREANSAAIYSPSGKLLHVNRSEPQVYILNRAEFNAYLAGLAMDKGAEYLPGSRVSDIERKSDRVVLKVVDRNGNKKDIDTRAAVIANGSGSALVRQASLDDAGDFAVGAQVEVEADGVNEVEVYTGKEKAPGFFAWLVPTITGRALAGLISRKRTGYYMKKLLTLLVEQGKIHPGEPEIMYSGVALKPLSRSSANRVLVVGSAAGQVKPTTGGGVYYGMICADIAADNLHRALESDNLTAGSLASYDRQWKRALGREMKLGYRGRKLYESLSNSRLDKIFDIIISSGIIKTLQESDDIRFDSHGAVLLKLAGHQALASTLKVLKLPVPSVRNKLR